MRSPTRDRFRDECSFAASSKERLKNPLRFSGGNFGAEVTNRDAEQASLASRPQTRSNHVESKGPGLGKLFLGVVVERVRDRGALARVELPRRRWCSIYRRTAACSRIAAAVFALDITVCPRPGCNGRGSGREVVVSLGCAIRRAGFHHGLLAIAIMISMAQIIVRNLDDDVRDKLRAMAAKNGRSMEEEIRELLRAATLGASLAPTAGLGTRLAARFRECGFDEDPLELRGRSAVPAELPQ